MTIMCSARPPLPTSQYLCPSYAYFKDIEVGEGISGMRRRRGQEKALHVLAEVHTAKNSKFPVCKYMETYWKQDMKTQ